MKRLTCLLLLFMMLLGMVGCGETQPAETTAPETTAVPETTVPETTAPAEKEMDYTPYMCPWTAEDLANARSDGKMHYFFMAAEGLHISRNQQNVDKWGDSSLVVFPDGKLMLIDTAPSAYGPVLLRNLQQMGVEYLDYIFISHPHSDHQNGGFDEYNKDGGILDNIGVGIVYCRNPGGAGTDKDLMVPTVCAEKNIPCEYVERGKVLEIGEVTMTVLWPEQGYCNILVPAGDINDNSIVHRFDFGAHSSLYAADLYVEGEAVLLKAVDNALLDVDLLKVPHHGHATSSSDAFLAAVTPELSVAMGRVPMTQNIRLRYQIIGSALLYDLVNGYIHVTADRDGTLEYTTTRNHDPNKQGELNTPSASLPPE